MTRLRLIVWASLAIALGLAVSVGILVAGAHDDPAAVRVDAMSALQLQDGDCVSSLHPLRAPVDRAALTEDAKSLGGRAGHVDGVFFGTALDLAADLAGTTVATGARTIWVLTSDAASGQRAVTEYEKVDLGRDGTAWLQGGSIRTISCEDAVS